MQASKAVVISHSCSVCLRGILFKPPRRPHPARQPGLKTALVSFVALLNASLVSREVLDSMTSAVRKSVWL